MIFLRIFRRASLPNPVCVCLYFCRTCMVLVRRSSCLCPACWTTPVWAASSTWPWRTPRCPSSRRAPTLCGASRRTWRTSEHTRTHTQPWCRDACRHAHTPFLTPPLSLRLYCSYFEGQYQCFFENCQFYIYVTLLDLFSYQCCLMSPSTSCQSTDTFKCKKHWYAPLENKHICFPTACRLKSLCTCVCVRRCKLTCVSVLFMDSCV